MKRLLGVSLLLACGAPAPAPIELSLDDATLTEAATAIAASGVSVVVAPDASLLAGCAHVTVHTAGPVPRAEAARLLAHALESSALTARETPEGWVIDLAAGGRVPRTCTDYLMMRVLDGMAGDGPSLPHEPPPAEEVIEEDEPTSDVPPGEPGSLDDPAIIAGITRVSDEEFVLTPEARDAFFERASQGNARVVPQAEGGRVIGVRLFGIRAGGTLAALGLRNGDTLRTIAGHDLASPDSALAAYAEVRATPGPVPLEITRAGQPMTISYRVAER